MNSLLYFIAAVLLLLGLMYVAGYIGHPDTQRTFGASANINKLITGTSDPDDTRGCATCKWY